MVVGNRLRALRITYALGSPHRNGIEDGFEKEKLKLGEASKRTIMGGPGQKEESLSKGKGQERAG